MCLRLGRWQNSNSFGLRLDTSYPRESIQEISPGRLDDAEKMREDTYDAPKMVLNGCRGVEVPQALLRNFSGVDARLSKLAHRNFGSFAQQFVPKSSLLLFGYVFFCQKIPPSHFLQPGLRECRSYLGFDIEDPNAYSGSTTGPTQTRHYLPVPCMLRNVRKVRSRPCKHSKQQT